MFAKSVPGVDQLGTQAEAELLEPNYDLNLKMLSPVNSWLRTCPTQFLFSEWKMGSSTRSMRDDEKERNKALHQHGLRERVLFLH